MPTAYLGGHVRLLHAKSRRLEPIATFSSDPRVGCVSDSSIMLTCLACPPKAVDMPAKKNRTQIIGHQFEDVLSKVILESVPHSLVSPAEAVCRREKRILTRVRILQIERFLTRCARAGVSLRIAPTGGYRAAG